MGMKSPENSPSKVLGILTEEVIRKFLLDCVNLPNPIDYPENRPGFVRWLRRWERLFKYRSQAEGNGGMVPVPEEHLEWFAPIIRTTLNRLWSQPDPRQRQWYCYRLRDAHRQMVRHLEGWGELPAWGGKNTAMRLTDYVLQDVPDIGPFEAAMYWLQHNQELLMYCAGPSCQAPYFFRAEKRQKFCSPECADPARREAKLKWWNESPNSPKNKAPQKAPIGPPNAANH